ncbi:MAG: T9SS type A sorting domain-containing protein, partial [Ginsengibacter sp.]
IMNGATMNVVNSAYVVTKDVSLANTGTVNIDSSTIKISGSIINGGSFDVTKGTVEMNGLSAQTIPANAFFTNKIKNLIISNNVTLAGQDSITGILSFGALNSKTFSTGGFLTLKSSAAGTANVADLTNNDTNTGNQVLDSVIVERYIPAVKKWRFLSIPTNTAQTIKMAWQEGSAAPNDNLVPGFGTQITGDGGTAAGFDVYTATPSMKTYNAIANSWTTVPNTNTALINHTVNNTIAYFVFVRGNRSATLITSPVSATVLRTKGVIKQGDQSVVTIASPATAFTAVGNPYPSRIDLRRMTPAPTTATKIYVWDPIATAGSTNGLGAYQTLTYNGSDFAVTPGGGSYGTPYNRNPDYLESGDAFLVGGNASPYSITFKEDIKPSGGNLISFTNGIPQTLQVKLFSNANGITLLMDGIKADIGPHFSNYLDNDDAYKVLNSSENVSLKRNGQLLSVERHDIITIQDTFYLTIGNMRVQNYQWQLKMNNLDQPGLSGFLEDSYLNTSSSLNLNGSTIVNFNIVNIPGSYTPGRFRIVFKQLSTLAVTFTSIKAYQQDKDIAVEWKVENENNIKKYDVEKSLDGNHYTFAKTVPANNATQSNYNWLDVNPSEGYNYYRILNTDISGKTAYSTVVKVFIGKAIQSITIYPNPVENGTINLQLTNQPAGKYGLRLLNEIGQVVISKQISHVQGSSIETIQLDKYSAHGIYQLEVTRPDGNKVNMNVIY